MAPRLSEDKIAISVSFFFHPISKRDVDAKKTSLNIEQFVLKAS